MRALSKGFTKAADFHTFSTAFLQEHVVTQNGRAQHDVFLSHAFDDRELILGVALTLENLGYSVYLDWRDDPSLDRSRVTPATAAVLRERMRASRCLLYATSDHSSESKWMPWELGFKDGLNTRVAILPVLKDLQTEYKGQEYLGIYPYFDVTDVNGLKAYIHRAVSVWVSFEQWLNGREPTTSGR